MAGRKTRAIAISRKKFIVILTLIVTFVLVIFVLTSKVARDGNIKQDEIHNESSNEDDGVELEEESNGVQIADVDDENSIGDSANSENDEDGNGAMSQENASNANYDISKWKANDYKVGDIEGNSYTVVWGDTLWEIAEARYGDGYKWIDIYNANKSQIGFLSNGNPLIIPGQVLEIP